jgi:SHS2 domain-containing protein
MSGKRIPGGPERGHRSLPHTADIRIEAWGPDPQGCLAEAVAALVDAFADTSGAQPERTVETDLAAETCADALMAVLDEVIYLLDAADAVPLGAEVEWRPGALRLRMPVASLHALGLTGAAPKGVSLHGLRFSPGERGYSCTATIDV